MDTVNNLSFAPIADADADAVIALWQRCGLTRPWNDPAADIALARGGANATILIGRADDAIVASALAVMADHHRADDLAADAADQHRRVGTAPRQRDVGGRIVPRTCQPAALPQRDDFADVVVGDRRK